MGIPGGANKDPEYDQIESLTTGIVKIKNDNSRLVGKVNQQHLGWRSGWYIDLYLPSAAPDNFVVIPYSSGNLLYDKFSFPINGGVSDAELLLTRNSYCCPIITADYSAASFNDVISFIFNPMLEGQNLNLIKIRDLNGNGIYYKNDVYGTVFEMYLMYAYYLPDQSANGAHVFFFCYYNGSAWAQVPTSDPGLPSSMQGFFAKVPVSIEAALINWSSTFNIQPTTIRNTDYCLYKQTFVANTSNKCTGTAALGALNNTVSTGKNVFLGFANQLEVDVLYSSVNTGDGDIWIDSSNNNVYWSGSAFGDTGLYDLTVGDIVKVYWYGLSPDIALEF